MTENKNETLKKKYKERGFQQLSLAEYYAMKKKAQRKKIQIPVHIKIIIATPFLIVFCFGVFFLPYMLYVIATTPMQSPDTEEPEKTVKTSVNK